MGLLDRMDFCSLVVAVDDYFINKLLMTWPTWLLCHPELLNMNIVIMYDADPASDRQMKGDDPRFKRLGEIWYEYREWHKGRGKAFYMQVVPWQMPDAKSQRERMLTALVHAPAYVTTPWYLKLDADTYATEPKGFYYDRWFNQRPAFIGNPWGYTKPGNALDQLNEWATDIEQLAEAPGYPVKGEVIRRSEDEHPPWKVNHRRMASWVMFGNTQWCVSTLEYLGDDLRLPFPSQDTYFSYVAEVQKRNFIVDKFRKYGWNHCRNERGLSAACQEVLAKYRSE